MRAEGEQAAENRVSSFLIMNDAQSPSSLDFVPKSDYDEKWRLDNKCPFHNQQLPESEKCGTGKSCSGDKVEPATGGSTFNKKSGDWKSDEKSKNPPAGCTAQEPAVSEWRWKNLYSVSDFDRPRRWGRRNLTSGDSISANFLRDLRTIDSRYKDPLTDDTEQNFLCNFREYLVNYQESCGVPRAEYCFSSLISTMGRATGRSLIALLYVLLNIVPVVEVFLHLLRFVLDKVISIRNSKDIRQTVIRCFVFTTELFSVYICFIFIFGFIVLPIVHMVIDIVAKIMLYS